MHYADRVNNQYPIPEGNALQHNPIVYSLRTLWTTFALWIIDTIYTLYIWKVNKALPPPALVVFMNAALPITQLLSMLIFFYPIVENYKRERE